MDSFKKHFKSSEIYYKEDLSLHSTIGIGGSASLFAYPKSFDELCHMIKYINFNGIKYFILGGGSNTLFSDSGFNGVVICTRKLDSIKCYGRYIFADCGVMYNKLYKCAFENSLCGLEFISHIPGSVGGLVKMNAGAYDGELSNLVESVIILRKNKIIKLSNKQMKFSYRECFGLIEGDIILSVVLKLRYDTKENIAHKTRTLNNLRKNSQPTSQKSLGSVFRRVGDIFPALLIDKAGLKGVKVGDAMISTKHSGFIVNLNKANSKQVLDLIDYIKKVVYNIYREDLILEIKYIE